MKGGEDLSKVILVVTQLEVEALDERCVDVESRPPFMIGERFEELHLGGGKSDDVKVPRPGLTCVSFDEHPQFSFKSSSRPGGRIRRR